MTIAITGLGVAAVNKTAIGEATILWQDSRRIEPTWVLSNEIDAEIERFRSAIREASAQLHAVRLQIPDDTPPDILAFIDTHLLMLEDRALIDAPTDLIRQEGCSADWALHVHRNAMVKVFDEMHDPYLKTRKDDLNYVVNRVLSILHGNQVEHPEILDGQIVIAHDLTPADAILLHHRGAIGFVTEFGSLMSHTAILARSMGIPAIVGAHGAAVTVQQGERVILDALNGTLLVGCNKQDYTVFEQRLKSEHAHQEQLKSLRDEAALTRDGTDLTLLANIELAEEVQVALDNAAEGIGLYRTEFLYMNRDDPPSEEEHFHTYRQVVEAMNGLPVTIRTLDLGADKQPSQELAAQGTGNPALGLRAIRLCLKEPEIFRTQIRGMLRATAYGPIKIMIPMLTTLDEGMQAKQIIEQELDALRERGLDLPDVVIGAMMETPAAALLANNFARHFDFLSIGTNDLVQYTLAVDRANDSVSHLYDSTHPAVLKLIHDIILAGKKQNTPVSICGEMAADLRFLPLLVGLGLDCFSMQPGSILEAKRLLRSLDASALQSSAKDLMQCHDVLEFETQLKALIPT
ncbi:MAG: phosphoenolpyruvate--protein phosphotransferase [bacterium]